MASQFNGTLSFGITLSREQVAKVKNDINQISLTDQGVEPEWDHEANDLRVRALKWWHSPQAIMAYATPYQIRRIYTEKELESFENDFFEFSDTVPN